MIFVTLEGTEAMEHDFVLDGFLFGSSDSNGLSSANTHFLLDFPGVSISAISRLSFWASTESSNSSWHMAYDGRG